MPRSSRAACLRLLTRLASADLRSVCGKQICFSSVILRVDDTLIHSADSSASARCGYTPPESKTLSDVSSGIHCLTDYPIHSLKWGGGGVEGVEERGRAESGEWGGWGDGG